MAQSHRRIRGSVAISVSQIDSIPEVATTLKVRILPSSPLGIKMKEHDLLRRLINAVGDCEDTQAILDICKEAEELLEAVDIESYRKELETFQFAALRATTAAEHLLKDFDKRFPKNDQ